MTGPHSLPKSHEKLLLAIIAGVFVMSLTLNVFFSDFPIGWDGFYHLRVLKLTGEQQKFVPYDSVSAGGRLQTYPPGYYALLLPLELLTGARAETIGRVLSPAMGALTIVALFVLAGRIFGETITALLAVLLFSTSAEVLGSFVSFAMPQAVGHFLIAAGLFSFLFSPALFPLIALSLSVTHAISTFSLLAYILIFALFDWKAMKTRAAIAAVMLLAFPLLWGRVLFPSYNVPTWGVPMNLQDYIGALGPLQVMAFLFVFSSVSRMKNGFSAAGAAMLILSRGPLLPARLIYHSILPLSISAAGFLKRGISGSFGKKAPLLAVVLLSAYLLTGAARWGNYAGPQLNAHDMDALKWITANTPEDSGVLGYKDLSAVWLLHYSGRPTVLDGYSEAVAGSYERMDDEYLAYSAGNLTEAGRIFSKYGVRYLFFNSAEEDIYKDRFNMTKFYALPILLNNGYAKVAKARNDGRLYRSSQ